MARNYARFYLLLDRLPLEDKDELKSSMVRQYTNGRTGSIREMSTEEYDEMCDGLDRMVGEHKAREIYRMELREKRSTVLHQLQKMGIDTANWERVNAYCRDPRIAGKEFRKLTLEDLEALNVKLRIIWRKEIDKNRQTYYSHLN